MFNLIEELFAPGKRHAEEEQRRLEHTRVDEGSNDPGAGPVDLASGQVLIRVPQRPSGTADGAGASAGGRAAPADSDPGARTGATRAVPPRQRRGVLRGPTGTDGLPSGGASRSPAGGSSPGPR